MSDHEAQMARDQERTSAVAFGNLPRQGYPRNEMREMSSPDTPPPGEIAGISNTTPLNPPPNTSPDCSPDTGLYPPPEMPSKMEEAEELAARFKVTVEELPDYLMRLKEDMEQKVREVQRFTEQFKTKPKNRAMRRAQKFGHSRLHY